MRFIRPREVVAMLGVSRATLWRMVRAGTFPPPVRISERNRGFLLEVVEEWMKARTADTAIGSKATPAGGSSRSGGAAAFMRAPASTSGPRS